MKALWMMFLLIPSIAGATLTLDGTDVVDSQTGYRWRQLSETQGMTSGEALAANTGYRLASKTDVCTVMSYLGTCTEETVLSSADASVAANMTSLFGVSLLAFASYNGGAVIFGTAPTGGSGFQFFTQLTGFNVGVFILFDALSPDTDSDGVFDFQDNCPAVSNAGQEDTDSNGKGDACNTAEDPDGDEWEIDNCPSDANNQTDTDGDGRGDACDTFPLNADNEYAQCLADLDSALNTPLLFSAFFVPDPDADGACQDLCPDSYGETDQEGCSLEQFCAKQEVMTTTGKQTCRKLDWRNDEPTMGEAERDCNYYMVSGVYQCLPN